MLKKFSEGEGAEDAEDADFVLPTWVVRFLLDLAKQAPVAGRPPRHVTRRDRLAREWALASARRRRKELKASGVDPDEALEQAARDLKRDHKELFGHLALTTVKDAIKHRRSRPR
jgi:hypothetical protein